VQATEIIRKLVDKIVLMPVEDEGLARPSGRHPVAGDKSQKAAQ
jgi:hypothetical protein